MSITDKINRLMEPHLFYAWLLGRPDAERYDNRSEVSDPLARYLQDATGLRAVRVCRRGIQPRYDATDPDFIALPAWARSFIDAQMSPQYNESKADEFDTTYGRRYTAAMAATLLLGLVPSLAGEPAVAVA